MKIKQLVLERNSNLIDEGRMGYSQLTMRKEKYSDFIQRVTDKMQELNTPYVSYPTKDIAIIQYQE